MSSEGAERERATNRLVRSAAGFLFDRGTVTPDHLHGLAMLTWITKPDDGKAYIHSTKIPALGLVYGAEVRLRALEEVGSRCTEISGARETAPLILEDTGFTNFYGAYRSSARLWMQDNFHSVRPLCQSAYNAGSLDDRKEIVNQLAALPPIPKPSGTQPTRAENYFTPLLFSLDPDVRFPIINENTWVKSLLRHLGVADASLLEKFLAMSRLLEEAGLGDAADLDQLGGTWGHDVTDFVPKDGKRPRLKMLVERRDRSGKPLPIKDASDVLSISKASTTAQRRRHNQMTNAFRSALKDDYPYRLVEGSSSECLFDIMVKKYDEDGNDLLVEAKSSVGSPHIRMAVGQLYHYWFHLKGNVDNPHLAILLPSKPADADIEFLQQMDIGTLWFERGALVTANEWLEHLTET